MAQGPLSHMWNYQLLRGRGDSSNENAAESADDGFEGAGNFAINIDGAVSPHLKVGGFLLYQTNDQISEGTGNINSIGYELKAIADNSRYDVSNVGGTAEPLTTEAPPLAATCLLKARPFTRQARLRA